MVLFLCLMVIKLWMLVSSVLMFVVMVFSIKKCMLSVFKVNVEISKYLFMLVWWYLIKFKIMVIVLKFFVIMFINISLLKFKVERLIKGFVFIGIFVFLIFNY